MALDWDYDDGVATITINRPERKNAITLAMRTEIEAAFLKAQDDSGVRAVILTGAGDNFSAGADVTEMSGLSMTDGLLRMRHLHRMARSVASMTKPVVAAVRGVCIGMSWSLALAADVVVAAEDARFQFGFRHIGLAPDGGAAFLLSRYLSIQRAKEILYSGRFVSGTEAQALGLALHAVASSDVAAKAKEIAGSFAIAPTLALSMTKRQFEAAPGQTYTEALDFESSMQTLMIYSEDFKEGTAAFREKRKPTFRGR